MQIIEPKSCLGFRVNLLPEMLISLLKLLLLLSFCFVSFGATTPPGEVEALRSIAKALGKTDWDFTVDPCGGKNGWNPGIQVKDSENYVICNCSISTDAACHVVKISLKSQSLQGTLPTDLSGLPYLTEFDLSRNYLSGTIPPQWGSTKLVNISFIANRLTGPIPKEFGNISTLANFTVEVNQLSGPLPMELGMLTRLEKLTLSSNKFTGSLPSSFSKLTSLTDFRISDNSFTGPIPAMITSWNLERLYIQGSGFSGPIPSGLSRLVNMTDLRISDLKAGNDSSFPLLSGMTGLITLVLRNCSIADKLPPYLGSLTINKIIDLSFNKLTGTIPDNYATLRETDYVYFTGNKLSGSISSSLTGKRAVDGSYNNFTYVGDCQRDSKTNLFSPSSVKNNAAAQLCVPSSCNKEYYGFHINCGGKLMVVDGQQYDDDTARSGPSSYTMSQINWVLSNTGNFLDNTEIEQTYQILNDSALSPSASPLYQSARISPLSMTYFGFCLKNGKYDVRLHFAEIRFSNNVSFASLGRRIFNVYIQGALVLDEFNVVQEAGGVGKPLVKTFTASVVNKTMEIRFYWAGKGTTILPIKGVYGPIISAISVTSHVKPPGSKTGIIIGVVVAAVVLLIGLVLGILWWKGCICRDQTDEELRGLNQRTVAFSLRQIKTATNNFDSANKIGEGGFGPVFKGVLSNGTVVAVKKLASKSTQGNREFLNEIGMISALQHPHLVKLYGCCIEGTNLLVIYEYMENNSLARALYGPEEHQIHLDWPTRQRICIGIARGLAFLHEESPLKIVHRDIKPTNVLLDKDLKPKISDFGLAKLDDQENSFINTRVAGTFGYMAPEYATRGYLTDKADVYSFGIVALEIVSGRSNSSFRTKGEAVFLIDVALALKAEGKLLELVDQRLGVEYNQDEVMDMIYIALLCSNSEAADRPSMSTVVSMLEGTVAVQAVDQDISESKKLQILQRKQHYDLISENSQTGWDMPTNESSTSGDHFPVSGNSTDYSVPK